MPTYQELVRDRKARDQERQALVAKADTLLAKEDFAPEDEADATPGAHVAVKPPRQGDDLLGVDGPDRRDLLPREPTGRGKKKHGLVDPVDRESVAMPMRLPVPLALLLDPGDRAAEIRDRGRRLDPFEHKCTASKKRAAATATADPPPTTSSG